MVFDTAQLNPIDINVEQRGVQRFLFRSVRRERVGARKSRTQDFLPNDASLFGSSVPRTFGAFLPDDSLKMTWIW